MKKIFVIITALFAVYVMNAQEINDSDRKIIDKIKAENAKYNTISSDFKQVKHLSFLGEDILSSGKFYYKKTDLLAMEYKDPSGDLMLINGDKFVMVSGGKRSETTSKASAKMRGMKAILSSCLQGDLYNMGAEKITCTEEPYFYVVTAKINTKSNKSNISKVVLFYDKKDFSLCTLKTIEPDESYIVYELINKKLNASIDNSVFLTSGK
ncbi:MAG: outer membrane lipoprotein carrier protein LolA [Bacteroidales bacterium]|jgi:outer membrane lipoprotein-sorting protein|nr:outer membrane lipoprotein carrier protein LolA [Bacteroidales bacterium]